MKLEIDLADVDALRKKHGELARQRDEILRAIAVLDAALKGTGSLTIGKTKPKTDDNGAHGTTETIDKESVFGRLPNRFRIGNMLTLNIDRETARKYLEEWIPDKVKVVQRQRGSQGNQYEKLTQ